MMESSRYDLAEEEDAGPSSNDVEKMLDGFVMERDDAAAAAALHTFTDAMTPEIDENLPWWQSVLFFLACGEPGSAPGKQPEPGLSSSDVDACVVDFELDGDGVVSYDEFLAFARRGCEQLAAAGWAPPASEETKEAPETSPLSALSLRVGKVLRIYEDGGNALRTAFDRFDVAKNGRLTVDELLAGLQGLGAAFEAMTRPEVEKLVIDAFDKDPDDGSTIAYPEFVAFVARARGQLDAAEA